MRWMRACTTRAGSPSPTWSRESEHLRPTVRFLLTCRPDRDLLRSLGALSPRLCAMSPHNGAGYDLVLRDVEGYVARLAASVQLAPDLSRLEFVAAVRDRSGGNFLYTRHLMHNLREQDVPVTRAALSALPGSLDGVYLDFLRRLKSQRQPEQYGEIKAVLAILAVVQQPADERHLARYTGLPPATVRGALADLRQYLRTDDTAPASTRTFALYHASFGELLLDAERAEEYWIDGAAAHQAIASAYREAHRDDWSGCDDYGLNYLATHLFEADDAEALQTLIDAAWIAERRKRRNGGYDGVLSDVDLAWRAAESSDQSAVAVGRPAPLLAQELRWALTVASIGTRALPAESAGPAGLGRYLGSRAGARLCEDQPVRVRPHRYPGAPRPGPTRAVAGRGAPGGTVRRKLAACQRAAIGQRAASGRARGDIAAAAAGTAPASRDRGARPGPAAIRRAPGGRRSTAGTTAATRANFSSIPGCGAQHLAGWRRPWPRPLAPGRGGRAPRRAAAGLRPDRRHGIRAGIGGPVRLAGRCPAAARGTRLVRPRFGTHAHRSRPGGSPAAASGSGGHDDRRRGPPGRDRRRARVRRADARTGA